MKGTHLLFILASCALVIFSFCKKSQERLPLVTTSVVSGGILEGRCSGVLYSEGDAEVTEKGVCWGLANNVTISDNKVVCETEEQTFTADITGLEAGKTYFVKAYAINEFGVSYGKVAQFTSIGVNFPNLNLSILPVTSNSVYFSFYLQQSNAFSYTAGICWSKSNLPTILNFTTPVVVKKLTDPPGNQTYNTQIKNLDSMTTYYARGFIQSNYGTQYGNLLTFTTPVPFNPVSFELISVGHTTALCSVDVSGINQTEVKSTGVCWSENQAPTIANNKKEVTGVALGNLTLVTLQANTTYYIRAYIKTDSKTIYGPEQKIIRTLKGTVSDIDGNIYNTAEIGGVEWMTSNLRVASFYDGTPIPKTTNASQWMANVNNNVPVCCSYGDNQSFDVPYGKLYPGYVAQHPKIAPLGWRVATTDDWEALLINAKLKELCMPGQWLNENGVTNSYGFSLYPAGYWDSHYAGIGQESRIWALPGVSSNNAVRVISYNSHSLAWFPSGNGLSIRCVKE